ncbi:MAG: hypothetical protein PSX80_03185 [bacterium]|nr:hypothetical protein [bacterium]
MKNKFQFAFAIAAIFAVGLACNMSTANMSSFKVGKDEGVKQESSSFKTGETIHGIATISNAPGKTTVKFNLAAEDVAGMTKGERVPGALVEVVVPDGGGTATYEVTIPGGAPSGKYMLSADMHNEAGEKKDGKTVAITIAGSKA